MILNLIDHLVRSSIVIEPLSQKMKSPTLSTAPDGVERMGLVNETADHRSSRSRSRRAWYWRHLSSGESGLGATDCWGDVIP